MAFIQKSWGGLDRGGERWRHKRFSGYADNDHDFHINGNSGIINYGIMVVWMIILAFCQKWKYESNGIIGLNEK